MVAICRVDMFYEPPISIDIFFWKGWTEKMTDKPLTVQIFAKEAKESQGLYGGKLFE